MVTPHSYVSLPEGRYLVAKLDDLTLQMFLVYDMGRCCSLRDLTLPGKLL